MWTVSELKQQGLSAFKGNYWNSVLAAFLLALLTGGVTVTSRFNSDPQQAPETFQNLPPQALAMVAGASITVFIVAMLLKIFVFNPLSVGCYTFFKSNVNDQETGIEVIKSGFGNYANVFFTLFLRDLFLVLWTCLLVVPGIIKAYSYRLVPYILGEEPELSPTEAINRSKEMMAGQKWRAFLLDLSFLGWLILSALTLGIVGFFWTNPYKRNTDAALYLAIKESGI